MPRSPSAFVEAVTEFVDTTAPMHLDEPQWRAALTAGPAGRTGRRGDGTTGPGGPDDRRCPTALAS